MVLGANGSGKSTLLRIAAVYEHPTQGTVRVLGETLGRTDVRVLRRRVGYNSASLSADLRPSVSAVDVVQDRQVRRPRTVVAPVHRGRPGTGVWHASCAWASAASPTDRLATLSTGERQRVLLARTLMNDPGVILLDEPSAGLDLGGREQLVAALAELAVSRPARRSCS